MPSRETHARKSYERAALDEHGIDRDPFQQFTIWYDDAVAAGLPEPEAMTLSTATSEGRPSARIVLLRGYDERGFCFFSNYSSQKGKELAANPYAAVTFHWVELERQVRIAGRVEKVTAAESDVYFQSRPSQSRIGAWSSPQSNVIPSRDALEQFFDDYQERYSDVTAIPRPEHWGGYRVIPERIEFWRDGAFRLHDRIIYQPDGSGWRTTRLYP